MEGCRRANWCLLSYRVITNEPTRGLGAGCAELGAWHTSLAAKARRRSSVLAMADPIGAAPPGMVLVTVLVPPGVGPGGQLQLESPYGGRFAVNVPEGVSPGQMMHVHVPGPTGGAAQMPHSQPSAPVEASEEDVAQLAAIFPDIGRASGRSAPA